MSEPERPRTVLDKSYRVLKVCYNCYHFFQPIGMYGDCGHCSRGTGHVADRFADRPVVKLHGKCKLWRPEPQ